MTVSLHICSPASFPLRKEMECPTCESVQRFGGYDQPWYGTTWICCGCGDSWSDGEMLPRPFKRAWREESKKRAEELWDRAEDMTGEYRKKWNEWIEGQMG